MAKPQFLVGETYRDTNGCYVVTEFDGTTVSYKYTDGKFADGKEREGDAEIKWRIECNFRLGATFSSSAFRSPSSTGGAGFFTHAEAFPIVANVIEKYSQTHPDFMVHREIVQALVREPQAQAIAERRLDKSANWCAGQMVAWFSKVFTDGRSEYDGRFERTKIGSYWAYRVRRHR
jgi:hypothetical protein